LASTDSGEVAFVSELFYSLALLACPVGMGLMMWMMMRGKGHDSPSKPGAAGADEVTRLRAEVDQLRAAQRNATDNRVALDSDHREPQ